MSNGDGSLGIALDHATRDVPVARPDQPVAEVTGTLAGTAFVSASDVAVLDGEILVGVVPIERLLAAGPDERIADVMDSDPPTVAPGDDQEVAAWRMVEHGESSVAVVDTGGRFAGLVPPNRMLRVLLEEHDEDLARLGGYLASTGRARQAAQEPVARRLWHRLPWLLIGLLGAMAAAVIVGAFEEQLEERVLVAFFIPAIVYMAGAVGTQTDIVLIRGMAAGVSVRSVIIRELVTGVVIGLVVALVFLPFALVAWGDSEVAVAVGLALFASCSLSTGVAIVLPWALKRLGSDPAFGTGPLATVIQDLLSVAVYLGIATAIV